MQIKLVALNLFDCFSWSLLLIMVLLFRWRFAKSIFIFFKKQTTGYVWHWNGKISSYSYFNKRKLFLFLIKRWFLVSMFLVCKYRLVDFTMHIIILIRRKQEKTNLLQNLYFFRGRGRRIQNDNSDRWEMRTLCFLCIWYHSYIPALWNFRPHSL